MIPQCIHSVRIKKNSRSLFNRKRANSGSAIAEFGAAFYAFCLAIMIPTINFLGFSASFSYSYVAANMMADTVAQAMTLKRAHQLLDETVINLPSDSLAQFLRVAPGVDGFKLDLVRTNMHGDTTVVTARNMKLPESEQNKCLLQYRISANYTVKPILNLGSIPLIGDIPILAKDTTVSFKLLRGIEHADDM